MRTRFDIINSLMDTAVPSFNQGKIVLEVLLDIRDLLIKLSQKTENLEEGK